MKKYKEYMDGVEVSPELHERLTHLAPAKRPAPWKKYGALAAALVLVVGAGAFGLSRLGDVGTGPATAELAEEEPDIAVVTDSAELPDGQAQTSGGYEVTEGEVVSYYMLPYIAYNDAEDMMMTDYSLAPPGALSREVELADLDTLLDGADMAVHLLWSDSWEWSGTAWFLEDGTPCAASLWADGDDIALNVEMMRGGDVPSCMVFPDESYETTTFNGVEITALKNIGYMAKDDGTQLRESRMVSCFANDVGYKLTLYGVDEEYLGAICAHFVRWAITEGFDLSALSVDGAVPIDTETGSPVGVPNGEDEASSPAYDPTQTQIWN